MQFVARVTGCRNKTARYFVIIIADKRFFGYFCSNNKKKN